MNDLHCCFLYNFPKPFRSTPMQHKCLLHPSKQKSKSFCCGTNDSLLRRRKYRGVCPSMGAFHIHLLSVIISIIPRASQKRNRFTPIQRGNFEFFISAAGFIRRYLTPILRLAAAAQSAEQSYGTPIKIFRKDFNCPKGTGFL